MSTYLDALFDVNLERTLWVEEQDLGTEKEVAHRGKRYAVNIPKRIEKHVTLRLRGLGRTRNGETGDLLLHIRLDKGDDIRRSLWLSETAARKGTDKTLQLNDRRIRMVVPPGSRDGLVIRLSGLGPRPSFDWRAPFQPRRHGNLLVKLCVYPDSITPNYGSFDTLSTEDMALEGWAYQKIDEVTNALSKGPFPVKPMRADEIADLFNERGRRAIFDALVRHLNLAHISITLTEWEDMAEPGSCNTIITTQGQQSYIGYSIHINTRFLDNPFCVAAICAHELCHVVYSESIEGRHKAFEHRLKSRQETLEAERTVDLLVFMYKIGEFQLRVARDTRLTLGYFDQAVFERLQGIVSRKLS